MKIVLLTTSEQVDRIFSDWGSYWELYARVEGRHDSPLPLRSCIRERDGVLETNVGEYTFAGVGQGEMLTEEWVRPIIIYAKHQCEGCHYPPDMCCMGPNASDEAFNAYTTASYLFDDVPFVEVDANP